MTTQGGVLNVCFGLRFYVPVNSFGHVETVSSPNHTFSWASLTKKFTSTSCTYFHLSLKVCVGMTNSVNPDQTAPLEQSDLCLPCLIMHVCLNIQAKYTLPKILIGRQSLVGVARLAYI